MGGGLAEKFTETLCKMRCLGNGIEESSYPPTNLYEYQRKRLTKIAFCKWLIPKDAFLVVLG